MKVSTFLEKAREVNPAMSFDGIEKYKTLNDVDLDPEAALWYYWYAASVLKSRWEEKEDIILKSPKWAMCYARDVVRGRWAAAEKSILKDKVLAYKYARHMVPLCKPKDINAVIHLLGCDSKLPSSDIRKLYCIKFYSDLGLDFINKEKYESA